MVNRVFSMAVNGHSVQDFSSCFLLPNPKTSQS